MNTKEITIAQFKETLSESISALKSGSSITVNYNGSSTITCRSKGKQLFRVNNVSPASAFDVQLCLESHSFHFNRYHQSPYAYEAVWRKPRVTIR